MVLRLAYYFVWRVAEAASVMAGYGYRPAGPDQHGKAVGANWDGVTNVHVVECETAKGITHAIRHWNLHTQSFLERYIFLRAPRVLALNKWLTFFASAFWHGVFPGYYLGFMSVPPIQEASKFFFATFRPLVTKDGAYDKGRLEYRAYALVRFVITHLTLDYFLSTFAMYDLHRCITVWRGWYFFGHFGAVAMLVAAGAAHVLCRRPKSREASVAASVEADVAAAAAGSQHPRSSAPASAGKPDSGKGAAAPEGKEGTRKRRQA